MWLTIRLDFYYILFGLEFFIFKKAHVINLSLKIHQVDIPKLKKKKKYHQLFECGQENSYVIYLHRLMKKNKHFCQNETKKKKK